MHDGAWVQIHDLEELLRDWMDTTTDFVGSFDSHFPIIQAIGIDGWWGCNVCGQGWPCLTIRTRIALGDIAAAPRV